MEELMEQYKEKFGEYFPLMCVQGNSDEKIASLIRSCIENNKPFETDDGVIY